MILEGVLEAKHRANCAASWATAFAVVFAVGGIALGFVDPGKGVIRHVSIVAGVLILWGAAAYLLLRAKDIRDKVPALAREVLVFNRGQKYAMILNPSDGFVVGDCDDHLHVLVQAENHRVLSLPTQIEVSQNEGFDVVKEVPLGKVSLSWYYFEPTRDGLIKEAKWLLGHGMITQEEIDRYYKLVALEKAEECNPRFIGAEVIL